MAPATPDISIASHRFAQRLRERLAELDIPPEMGIYPLDSRFRRIGIAWPTFALGSARALLLQVAHPTVAQGVFEYSNFRRDPIGRGVRTFLGVFAVSLGTQETALRIARMIFERHAAITGVIPAEPDRPARRYSAMEPEANLWVWATLVEGVMYAHREAGHRIPDDVLDEMYDETKIFGAFFNVRERDMPTTRQAFLHWFDDMVEQRLHVTPAGREVADALFGKGAPTPQRQAGWIVRWLSAETLPARIRDQFGLRSTSASRAFVATVRTGARAFCAVTPESLITIPLAWIPHLRVTAARLPRPVRQPANAIARTARQQMQRQMARRHAA